MNYEFTTRVPKYTFEFLVSYSVKEGKPVFETVEYDQLYLDISELNKEVFRHLNAAAINNMESVAQEYEEKTATRTLSTRFPK